MTQPIHPMLTTMVRRMGDQLDFDGEPFGATLSTSEIVTLARAAIQALMEPDEGMVEAGEMAGGYAYEYLHNATVCPPAVVYQAMLKPLLGDEG